MKARLLETLMVNPDGMTYEELSKELGITYRSVLRAIVRFESDVFKIKKTVDKPRKISLERI